MVSEFSYISQNFIRQPRFGAVALPSLVNWRLNALTPTFLNHDKQGEVTGDKYVKPEPDDNTRWTLKKKCAALPRSFYRLKTDLNLLYPSLEKLFVEHLETAKATAEFADLISLILEQKAVSKNNRLFITPVPELSYSFTEKQWAPIRELFQSKQHTCPSHKRHYPQELEEFVEAVNIFRKKKGKNNLSPKAVRAITEIMNDKKLTEANIQTIFNRAGLPQVPLKTLIQYAVFKAQGRIMMDSVYPGKQTEAKNKRKAALALAETLEALVLFSPKTMSERVQFWFNQQASKIVKPVFKRYEQWSPEFCN